MFKCNDCEIEVPENEMTRYVENYDYDDAYVSVNKINTDCIIILNDDLKKDKKNDI